jgi:hypothetical protein
MSLDNGGPVFSSFVVSSPGSFLEPSYKNYFEEENKEENEPPFTSRQFEIDGAELDNDQIPRSKKITQEHNPNKGKKARSIV